MFLFHVQILRADKAEECNRSWHFDFNQIKVRTPRDVTPQGVALGRGPVPSVRLLKTGS